MACRLPHRLRMKKLVRWAPVLLLALNACGGHDDPTEVLPAAYPIDLRLAACTRPLAEFCLRAGCRSYDEQVRFFEAYAQGSGCTIVLGSLRLGTCGQLRYADSGYLDGATIWYFDASGSVVAGGRYDDVVADRCDDPPYGFAPDCQRQVTRDLCRERTTAP
jgi:hypothetical protein